MAACHRHRHNWSVPTILLAFAGWLPVAAQAALGEAADSVLRDHAALSGTALTRTSAGGFDVLESTTPDGFSVRQYVSPQGIVFAAAWKGPGMPNLKVVLGQYYSRYSADLYTRAASPKLHTIGTRDFVLQVAKLPRGLAGSSYVPALVPPGASIEAVR